MSEKIRVEFTRAEYEVVLETMQERLPNYRGSVGPSLRDVDVLDAVRALVAADRYPRLVS